MNSELYDKTYNLPSDVIKRIQTVLISIPTGDGVRRAKMLLRNGKITYQDMKRIKHDFENKFERGSQQYELAGGDLMKNFIDSRLNQDRDAVERGKEIKRDLDVDTMRATRAQQTPRLNEELSETDIEGLKENALAIIVNRDNQFLLLRRSNDPDIWQPNKWALVGGGVEDGETPEEAVKREIKEETGLDINNFKQKFTIQRNPDSIEHIFIAKYDGDPFEINLNFEHSTYGWYSPEELVYLNRVPNLIDYVNLAFKQYD